MWTRRQVMISATAFALGGVVSSNQAKAVVRKVVLIHGRSQQGRNSEQLKIEWLGALKSGLKGIGKALPENIHVRVPFYGDMLDNFANQLDLPLTSEIREKGDETVEEFLLFQAQLAEEVRIQAGVTDAQVNEEYGANAKPKGPQNWEWVQAIIRAIDKHAVGVSQRALETFTRDVFLYISRSVVRDEIDEIVKKEIGNEPTLIVAHSLGTVVAYNVLRTGNNQLKIPLFVTLGSPLGIRAIKKQFRPLSYPQQVAAWYNAYDKRDIVALNPLDEDNFPVTPSIENYDQVRNKTDNRHGIIGYLDDKRVAARIATELNL